MKGKTIQRIVMSVLVIGTISLLAVPVARAQIEYFLLGAVVGEAILGEEIEPFAANQIYRNVKEAKKADIEEIRFVKISFLGGINTRKNQDKTIKQIFEGIEVVKKQIEEGYEYKWIAIWREGTILIFAYVLEGYY